MFPGTTGLAIAAAFCKTCRSGTNGALRVEVCELQVRNRKVLVEQPPSCFNPCFVYLKVQKRKLKTVVE